MAASLGIDRMSASQVSRICGSPDDIVDDPQKRDLSDVSSPYIWVDATYVKCRDGGHVSSCVSIARREHRPFRCLRSGAHAVREPPVSRLDIAISSLRAASGR